MADPKGNLVTPVGHRADGSIHAFELSDNDLIKVLSLSDDISDTLRIALLDANLAAGTSSLLSSAVPAGEYWIVTNLYVQVNSATITYITSKIDVSGTGYNIAVDLRTAGTFFISRQFNAVMKPGDKIGAQVDGATAGDDLVIHVLGYKKTIG